MPVNSINSAKLSQYKANNNDGLNKSAYFAAPQFKADSFSKSNVAFKGAASIAAKIEQLSVVSKSGNSQDVRPRIKSELWSILSSLSAAVGDFSTKAMSFADESKVALRHGMAPANITKDAGIYKSLLSTASECDDGIKSVKGFIAVNLPDDKFSAQDLSRIEEVYSPAKAAFDSAKSFGDYIVQIDKSMESMALHGGY